MKNYIQIFTLICLALICNENSKAQFNVLNLTHDAINTLSKQKNKEPLKLTDLSGTSQSSSILNYISLKSSTEEKSATGNLGIDFGRSQIILKITTPFESGKESQPLTLNGLSGGSSGTFEFKKIWWQPQPNNVAMKEIFDKHKVAKGIANETIITFKDLDSLERLEFLKDAVILERGWDLSFSGGISNNEFTYLKDTSSLEIIEGSEHNYVAGITITRNYKSKKQLILAFQYQSKYKAGSKGTYIFRINNNLSEQKEIALGAPNQSEDYKVGLEYRNGFAGKKAGDKLALSMSANALLKSELISLDVHAYFLQLFEKDDNKKSVYKGLNGGVFLGYNSSEKYKINFGKKNIIFGVFIAPTFDSLFN